MTPELSEGSTITYKKCKSPKSKLEACQPSGYLNIFASWTGAYAKTSELF